MIPCHSCHRHVRDVELACPFCSARLQQASAPLRELVGVLGMLTMGAALLGAVGCSTDSIDDPQAGTTSSTDGTAETTGTTSSGSEVTTMTMTVTDTDDTTDPQTNTSGGFYAGPDIDIAPSTDCDPFAQDCPEGEKCVPYGSTGGNWDANKCVVVTGSNAAGDACVYGGVVEATDDCDQDTHCWSVKDVEGMNVGVCTPFCQGAVNDPVCPAGSDCFVSNEGHVAMCIDLCDPLLQECVEGDGCFYNGGDGFSCFYTTQDLPAGNTCDFLNDCAPGNFCAAAEWVPNCGGAKCCAAYCDLEEPDPCLDPGLECTAFFEPPAPNGYDNVGSCVAPPP